MDDSVVFTNEINDINRVINKNERGIENRDRIRCKPRALRTTFSSTSTSNVNNIVINS